MGRGSVGSPFWLTERRRFLVAFLAMVFVAVACSSATEYGQTGTTVVDQGTTVKPSEPVVEPAETEPVEASNAPAAAPTPVGAGDLVEAPTPVSADEPELIDGKTADEHFAAAGVNTGEPATFLVPALPQLADVGAVAYGSPIDEATVDVSDIAYPLMGFTPDGQSRLVQVPGATEFCADGLPSTQLGITDVVTDAARPLDDGNEHLQDVTAIHRGPNDFVLLEVGCGKYGGPGAIAKIASDGSLSEYRTISGLGGDLWMFDPRWGWTDNGELVVVVPMAGLDDRAVHNYVRVESGEVIEKVAAPLLVDVRLSSGHQITVVPRTDGGEGRQVLVNGESVWSGVIGDWDHSYLDFVAIGGSGGVVVQTRRSWDEPTVQIIDKPGSSVAIAPNSEVFAISYDDGTDLIGPLVVDRLSELAGRDLAFSPDGTRLSMRHGDSDVPAVTTWTFEPAIADPGAIVPGTIVSSGGLGPIRVGMTIAEVEEATGRSFMVESIGPLGADECMWAYSEDLLGVSVIGEAQSDNPADAIVKAVSVQSPMYPTPSGVRIGDSTAKVLGLFPGQIQTSPHTYSSGQYLDYLPQDEGELTTVRFETRVGGQVDVIHAGIIAWTQLVEGCA